MADLSPEREPLDAKFPVTAGELAKRVVRLRERQILVQNYKRILRHNHFLTIL